METVLPKLCRTHLKKNCLVLIQQIFTDEFLLSSLKQERATALSNAKGYCFIQYKGCVIMS